jgi:putative acetyltransferase
LDNTNIRIRAEKPEDSEQISQLMQAAFKDHPFSHNNEHHIVNGLRRANNIATSLIAEQDNEVVGYVAFSPVQIDGIHMNWFGLGPIGVAPALQKQGIGKQLIQSGLEILKSAGANGCVVLGDPAYYKKFGFDVNPRMILEGVPPEYFMALPFHGETTQGQVSYHRAFYEHE